MGRIDPLAIERQQSLRGADREHMVCMLREPLRPPAGAARQFEDGLKATAPFERLKEGGDFLSILVARPPSDASSHADVPPELEHRLVILAGPGAVVGDLVSDQRVSARLAGHLSGHHQSRSAWSWSSRRPRQLLQT